MKRGRSDTHDQGFGYFVTTSLSRFVRLFDKDDYAQVILRNLDFYRVRSGFRLLAYVVMPTHIHLIIVPKLGCTVSDIMRDFKKYTAREIVRLLQERKQLDILAEFREASQQYHPKESRQYQVWEDRFDDVAIWSAEVLKTKVEYIHNNPVRAGLVESPVDYPYSSARDCLLGDHSVKSVDSEHYPVGSGRGPDTHICAGPEEVMK